ncbi:hypothetical protein K461DRAFT_147177 [Myriangium duriaei CBS 260.36]|uniref:DUF7730 domain-containing protein n=1 Tax=Myriangium duriaei CBS 260.36 TaxID=1168546 RepID=A0A9P4J398_9PEZI|nr:hypothetical protein K461DRAFT_147177 [Myriangium duriaei CBS 260.36]
MPFRLQDWWRHKNAVIRTRRSKDEPADNDAHQRLVVTPTPLTLDLRAQDAVAESPFFQRLPDEIRRMILIEAFGGRTMHVDLETSYPRVHDFSQHLIDSPFKQRHCGVVGGYGCLPLRDKSLPLKPRWHGSVCHRNPEYNLHQEPRKRRTSSPWHDCCLEAKFINCCRWSGQWPDKCFVGCAGWLTACRRAHSEGIAVLYLTNVFYLRLRRPQTEEARRDIRMLVTAPRMSMITSLELELDLTRHELSTPPLPYGPSGTPKEMVVYKEFLQLLPGAFPNLLYLDAFPTLHWMGCRTDDEHRDFSERFMLQPFDELVRQMPMAGHAALEFNLGLPLSYYNTQLVVHFLASRRLERDRKHYQEERVWRAIPGKDDGGKLGYWINRGEDDVSRMYGMSTMH